MDGDIEIPMVTAGQTMAVAAIMVGCTIANFGKSEDTKETLTALHLTLLAIFLYQLLMPAKHKDKVIGILETIIVELRDNETQTPSTGATSTP